MTATATPPPADDIAVLQQALAWYQQGQSVALVTVVNTWGSSPRPPGSLMAMTAAGQWIGSVSGGCVETELFQRFADQPSSTDSLPELVDYGVDSEQANRLGLPCGGRLQLLIEQLKPDEPLGQLVEQLMQGELVTRQVSLADGQVSYQVGQAVKPLDFTERALAKTFGPSWQLLLIGNGQLASHLATMALRLDYRVTICDPREQVEAVAPIDGVDYSTMMPDDAVMSLANQPRAAIVTLAHDPRQDDLALTAALTSRAFYIGALGSKRSAQNRRARLASLGHSDAELARVHGPAGLFIGSKRPAEIAVSILAQITAIRNGVN